MDELSTKNNPKFYFSSLSEAETWLDDNAKHYDNKLWKKMRAMFVTQRKSATAIASSALAG